MPDERAARARGAAVSVRAVKHVPAEEDRVARIQNGRTFKARILRRYLRYRPPRDTGLPVGEVAARSGFRSVYHFSRRVKEQTGSSPTALRRERWEDP
jgi:AraC-like DNA-binding protein